MKSRQKLSAAVLCCLLVPAAAHAQSSEGADADAAPSDLPDRPEDLAAAVIRGERAYRVNCAMCHGAGGRGDGPTARWIDPKPRDLVAGHYRWRTTPSGELPTDADLLRTIDEGVPGTAMPPWKDRLAERTRRDLVQYVKTFCEGFRTDDPAEPIAISEPPEATTEAIALGAAVYERFQCAHCHGEDGQGDGPSSDGLLDEKGRPIPAYDFTKGLYKGGSTPQAIYRTFMTGLNGTPMPSFGDSITEDERWPLVLYTLSLNRERGVLDYLFRPLEEQKP